MQNIIDRSARIIFLGKNLLDKNITKMSLYTILF